MIQQLADPKVFDKVYEKLLFLAWHKYRIQRGDAEDIAQNAVTTYCEVRERYAEEENQYGILLGIFNNKCLEFIDAAVRDKKRMERLSATPDARRTNPWLDPEGHGAPRSVIEDLVKKENGRLILAALAEMRPEAREMFDLLAKERVGRKGLIEKYGLNKNTVDSRLHVFRKELRSLLEGKGVTPT